MGLNLKNVNCIKIDVEGHELNVLKGTIKTIEKYSPDFIVEVWNKEEFIKFMQEMRYNVKPIYEIYYFATKH